MAADVSSLLDKVRDRCQELNAQALDALLTDLDAVVPDSGESSDGEKLRDSRQVVTAEDARGFTNEITYTSDKAEWTEYGTEAHEISAGRPPWALHFTWPKVGGEVFFRSVMWKPGPGVDRNRGWFSRAMDRWPDHVGASG